MRKLFAGTFAAIMTVVTLGITGLPVAAKADTLMTVEGTLTSISGATLPATLTVQSGLNTYTVNVTSSTEIVRKFNGPSDLSEYAVADLVQVRGTMSGSTIDATKIKNLTLQRLGGEFWGKIVSIDSTAKTFVYDVTRKNVDDQTVSVVSSTRIFQGNRKGTFSDLSVGMTVKVIGLWRKSQKTITADRVLIKLTEIEGKISAVDCTSTPNTVNVLSKKGKTWTLTLTDSTSIRDKRNGAILCADLAVNDKVNVRALKTGNLTGNAVQIYDKSRGKNRNTFSGSIKSIDAATNTFVLDRVNDDSDYTVTVTGATILVNDDGNVITFASLATGHKVIVKGVKVSSAITANLVIDRNLP